MKSVPTTLEEAWTWDEFAQLAETLRKSLPSSKYPFAYNWQGNGVTRWLSWLFEADGRFLAEDLIAPAIDSDAGRQAVEFTSSFFAKNFVPKNNSVKSTTYAADTWYAQTAAMTFGGAFLIPDADSTLDFEWGATFSPRKVRSAGDFGGNALVATKATAKPELAAKFLDFVTTEGPMRDFCASSSLLPTRKDLVAKGIEFAVRPELSPVFVGQASTVKAEDSSQVASPNMSKIITVLKDQLEQAFVGGQRRRRPPCRGCPTASRRPPRRESSAVSVRSLSAARTRESVAAYAFLSPNLLLLGLFVFVPLVGTVVISLQKTDGFGSGTFVGADNYLRLVERPAVLALGGQHGAVHRCWSRRSRWGLGLLAAVLLNSVLPARPALRSAVIVPMAISGVATALMGLLIFDENSGLINLLFRSVGLPGVSWQSGGAAAFASVVLVTLWWRVGFNMLIYLAGLQGVSPDVYEAGRLDGASTWQLFRHLTVPLVGPSSFFLLIMNVIYSFQVFDLVFVMTGGGPENATSVLVTYAYDNGFVTRDQGYAAALGLVLLLIMLAFTAVQWRISRTRDLVG